MNLVIDTIKQRRSIRGFKEQQVSDSDLQTVLDCTLCAPSACNKQSWHFTVIQNPDLIQYLNDTAKANLKKSDKIPAPPLLHKAIPYLERAYDIYRSDDSPLSTMLIEDSQVRFSTLTNRSPDFSGRLAIQVTNFMEHVADARNIARIERF